MGSATARVRIQPNGSQVIAALPGGTIVQVLFGEAVVDGIEWVKIRLAGGQTGWMARFLLTFLVERLGNTATTRPPATITAAPSPALATPASPGATQPLALTNAPLASATVTPPSAPPPTITPTSTDSVAATPTSTSAPINPPAATATPP